MHSVVVDESVQVVFNCSHQSNPAIVNIAWFYDSQIILPSEDLFTIQDSLLLVSNLTYKLNGHHVIDCIVQNSIGIGSANASLTVNLTVSPTDKPTSVTTNPITPVRTDSLATKPWTTSTESSSLQTRNPASTKTTNPVTSRQRATPLPKTTNDNVPIIAGSAAGAGVLVLLIAVILCVCIKKKRLSPSALKSRQCRESNDNDYDTVINDIPRDRPGESAETTTATYATVNLALQNETESNINTASVSVALIVQNSTNTCDNAHVNGEVERLDDKSPSHDVELDDMYAKPIKEGKKTPQQAITQNNANEDISHEEKEQKKERPMLKPKPKRGRLTNNEDENVNMESTTETISVGGVHETTPSPYDDVTPTLQSNNNRDSMALSNETTQLTGERLGEGEQTTKMKNEEELTYAELDLSSVQSRRTIEVKVDEEVVYAEFKN